MAKMISFLRANKRVIIFSLVFAFSAFLLIHPGELGRFYALLFFAIFVMLIASQLFWIRRVLDLGERFIPGKPRPAWLAVIAGVVYLFFFAYSFRSFGIGHISRAADPRLRSVLIVGAFSWWLVGSWAGFGLVMVFWTVDRATRAAAWVYRRAREAAAGHAAALKPAAIALPSPTRRRFLEQTAIAVSATPFVAAAYGLLYGRLDVQVTHRRIRLARLPKAFEGFRIAQLSDFHISPFMPADQIRRCVTITNQLKADLVVLTGDFVGWDPEAQGEVVQALAGLRAPYGVFGCLGNHERSTHTEESITRLFAAQGIRILRQERAPIQLHGETLNLIGVDDSQPDLKVVERLVMPDTRQHSVDPLARPLRSRGRTRHRLDPGRAHSRRPVVARVPPPRPVPQPPGDALRQGMVRKSRRTTLRQPRHRNHRLPHPVRLPAGDYGIGVDQNLTSSVMRTSSQQACGR
ncbi:MAG: metallophosphoesterase [Blastocatellia bacterium]|nr:metallophosphoesterase [Blastocatellia bacterium]